MIRVMLADDQKILAEGIKSVLQTSPEIEVCGIAYNGVQAVDMAKELHPDVILMDVRMPEMNGVAATKRIKEASPDIKIIILYPERHKQRRKRLSLKGYRLYRAHRRHKKRLCGRYHTAIQNSQKDYGRSYARLVG